jgi:uncharacterized protein YjbI with pentapeptide repeats
LSTLRPVSWTKALEEADTLSEELRGVEFGHRAPDEIARVIEVLRLSGKMTPWVDRRRRLAAALSYWSSVLALETDVLVHTPVLAAAVDGETDNSTEPAHVDSLEALESLKKEMPLDSVKVFDLRVGRLPDIRKVEITKSRLIGGEFEQALELRDLNVDDSTFIAFDFGSVKISRELKASHCQFFGGNLMFEVRSSDFANAVARYCRFEHVKFGSTSFENAELSVNPATRTDGARTQDGVWKWVNELNLANRGPVRFTDCEFGDGVSFQSAVLVDVEFKRCRLRGADFGAAILADANGPRLLRAKFEDCDLQGANFLSAVNVGWADFDAVSQVGAALPLDTDTPAL